jgi:branched-subunit amino acid transport protein
MTENFLLYLLTMAGVTYLVRMLPLVFMKRKIENRFVLSFLYYIPYTVLAVMTVPAVFTSTGSLPSAAIGTAVALLLAWKKKGLLTVAVGASSAALLVELFLRYALPLFA